MKLLHKEKLQKYMAIRKFPASIGYDTSRRDTLCGSTYSGTVKTFGRFISLRDEDNDTKNILRNSQGLVIDPEG